MLNVSQNYLTELSTTRLIRNRVEGTITTTLQGALSVNNTNIIPGSLSIERRATDKNTFNIGSVYIGCCKITVKLEGVTQDDLVGCPIVLNYIYTLQDNTEETIPLGTFRINEVKQTKKIFTLTCYDLLSNFDAPCQMDYNGKIFDAIIEMLNYVPTFTLGQTSIEIAALPNGDKDIDIHKENFSTYRDVLSEMATVMGCFVYVKPSDNKIYFMPLVVKQTPDRIIAANNIVTSTLYTTNTIIKDINAGFLNKEGGYTSQTAIVNIDGATLNVGNINLYTEISTEDAQDILEELAAVLQNLQYRVSTLDTIPMPEIELGDTVQATTQGGQTIITLIEHTMWQYHKKQSFGSYGLDIQKQSVKSAINKAIDKVQEQEGFESINVYGSIYDDLGVSANAESQAFTLVLKIKKNSQIYLTFSVNIDTNTEQDVELYLYVNNQQMPKTFIIRALQGEYSYTQSFNIPLDFLTTNDGENYKVILGVKPLTDSITMKPYSQLCALACNVQKGESGTPSTPEDFGFLVSWLTQAGGLYDDNNNLVVSISQLLTEAQGNFFAQAGTAGANTQVLENYPTGTILIIDKTTLNGISIPYNWISGLETHVRVVVFQPGATFSITGPTFAGNTSIEMVYLPKTISQIGTLTNQYLFSRDRQTVLYTEEDFGEKALYNVSNTYGRGKDFVSNYAGTTLDSTFCAAYGFSGYQNVTFFGITPSLDLSYEVGEGTEGAGLRFNASDLDLPPGLYDSANRLICTWAKIEALGIYQDCYDLRRGLIANEVNNADESGRNKSIIYQLGRLFKKGKKLIFPADFNTHGTRGTAQGGGGIADGGCIGETNTIKVLVFKGAVQLGRRAFWYATFDYIYLPEGSTAQGVTSSYIPFRHFQNANAQIYTNAADDASHTFAAGLGLTVSSSVLKNANVNYLGGNV